MLALDAAPAVAKVARTATVVAREGTTTLEAEDAQLSGDAEVVPRSDGWTGESRYSGAGYLRLGGGTATFDVATGQPARAAGGRPAPGQHSRDLLALWRNCSWRRPLRRHRSAG